MIWAALMAAAVPYRAALIVGVSVGFDGGAPLQFADDDAARYFELLSTRVDEARILTVLDPDSQKLFPDVASVAGAPTLLALDESLSELKTRAELARSDGKRTELLFVYVGHGRVRGGEGEVKLLDGSVERHALHEKVLAAKSFDRVHVIVDACSAYHFVNARGDEDVDRAFESFLTSETLGAHPTAGAALATSGEGPTHEWSEIRGGLFSHEVRSGLLGAADADVDGLVTYYELEAFLAAANLGVPAPLGRPRVWVRAPAVELHAALAPTVRSGPAVSFEADVEGHFLVIDDRGLRHAELHREPGRVGRVTLDARRSYVVVGPTGRVVARSKAGESVHVSSSATDFGEWRHERGTESLPAIFAEPFGQRFLGGYAAGLATISDSSVSAPYPWLSWVAFGVGVVALSGSVWQGIQATSEHTRYLEAHDGDERDRLAESVATKRGWAVGLGLTAGLGLVTGIVSLVAEP